MKELKVRKIGNSLGSIFPKDWGVEDGAKLEQTAEIERNEIIFNLSVTNKLEELMKDGSAKAALEAGKLLVEEILHNTIDNTGLIKEVE